MDARREGGMEELREAHKKNNEKLKTLKEMGVDANEGEGGPSNGGWFAIGFIVAPGVIGLVSYILWFMGDLMGEFFYWLAWLVWPAGLIGGLVWSFTKGNKYFAYGLLTILVGVPMVLFLAIFVMIVVLLGL